PLALAQQVVEELLDIAGYRIDAALALVVEVAGEHLGVTRLVDHLRALEKFRVVARYHINELAAGEHRALLTMEELGEAPAGEFDIELTLRLAIKLVPDGAAVAVDHPVVEDSRFELHRLRPVDILRHVPLVALGVFVEPAHVRGVDGVVALIDGIETALQRVLGLDGHEEFSFRCTLKLKQTIVWF